MHEEAALAHPVRRDQPMARSRSSSVARRLAVRGLVEAHQQPAFHRADFAVGLSENAARSMGAAVLDA
jgi:hypothetical protein